MQSNSQKFNCLPALKNFIILFPFFLLLLVQCSRINNDNHLIQFWYQTNGCDCEKNIADSNPVFDRITNLYFNENGNLIKSIDDKSILSYLYDSDQRIILKTTTVLHDPIWHYTEYYTYEHGVLKTISVVGDISKKVKYFNLRGLVDSSVFFYENKISSK